MNTKIIILKFLSVIPAKAGIQFFLSIFCFSIFLPFTSSVHAQRVSLSISPPLVESMMKPGKEIMVAFTLENPGDPVIMKSKVVSFLPTGKNGNVELLNDSMGPVRFSLDNSTLKLGEPFVLQSRHTQQLLLRMRILEGAPEGDYYYTLIAETQQPPSVDGNTASTVKAGIGAHILISVTESGNIPVQARIAQFDVLSSIKFQLFGKTYRFVNSTSPIPVILTLDNPGKFSLNPQGSIKLQGPFGEKAEYNLIPLPVLAESQRIIPATPSASMQNPPESSFILSGLFMGPYKLQSTVLFSENAPPLVSSVSFIAFPIHIIFTGFGILALGIAITMLWKKYHYEAP